ncbi:MULTISPECIES: DNA cytosine methyltransferase [unclassified Pantoea]|uniref:DNA cytosine methyltransferase n=1 Tax=unclassified Pantoea TaxID=2630326 RepID=UPI001CD32990|nr:MULTISPECIES: DNA cytosine methyltransferase [unclassified Pantoea]MCA1176660.1 DNA cytosine methyltransferase [Pantoea sp. alder69]MCA1251573.1 DNA cytosine methyltransferase [Pantoea sp. alder70]MCA1264296.1 DNA cytosine methyltransferase [Pantoea sp. alder81]
MNKIKVFDFFSGCGGTSQGFHQAGFDVVFGLDFDADAAASFSENFPNSTFINADIRSVDEDILARFKEQVAENCPVLFSGCAPCQPYSRQNSNKKNDDPRLDLLKEFARFVKKNVPDFVFVENVPGMQKFDKSEGTFNDFLKTLSYLGYNFDYKVLPASWFGVPQTRERLVLLAAKDYEVSLPEKTHGDGKNPYSTVREWISHLPPIGAGESHAHIKDHIAAKLSEKNLQRIQCTPEGGGRESWPAHLLLECHKKHKGHTDVYGRLSWDKPASGLTTKCISYSNGRFGHPDQNRALTVREAACLQTFPDHYKFVGGMQSKARQIGNAVPPKMSEAIGKHILQLVEKNKNKYE